MKIKFASLLSALCLLTSPVLLHAQENTADENRPFLAVPKLERAPTIDGVINPEEWEGAAMISGFMGATGQWSGRIAPMESRIYVAHDGQRFYMAVYCELPPGVKPSMKHRKRNDPVFMDNYQLELWLTPPVRDRLVTYQMIGNAYGAIFDNRQIPDLGISNVQWNGEWEFANTYVTGEYWMAEVAIDFDQLDSQPISPDVPWRGMVAVAWPQRSWPYTFGWYKNVDTHAKFRFADDGNTVQVADLTALFENKLAPKLTLINAEPTAQTFTLEFESRGQQWRETVQVPASGRKTVEYAFELPAFPERGRPEGVRITVRDQRDGVLLDGDWFYSPAERKEIQRQPAEPKPWAMDTRMQFAPLSLGIKAWADVLDYPQRDKLKQVRFNVKAKDGGKVVLSQIVDTFDYDSAETLIWLPKDLPYGDYTVDIVFEDAQGKAMVTDSKSFKHEDLTKRFVWMGNELGINATIAPPFEAVTVKGNQLDVWGRTVTMQGAFPTQITSQKQPLLAAPVNLVAVIDGAKVPAKVTAPFKLTSQKDTEVTFTGAYEVAGLAVQLEGKMAYDGMIFYSMEATPIAGQPVQTVDRLYLAIPVVGKHAEYYFTTGGGWSPGMGMTAGDGKIWDSSEFGDFVPYLGLSDDHLALQWFTDTDYTWILGDDFYAAQIMRSGDTVEMQINFVRRSGPLEAFSAEFGLIATPIKPMPSNWRNTVLDNRKVRDSTINFFYGPGHGGTPIDLHDTATLAKVLGIELDGRHPDVVLAEIEPQAHRLKSEISLPSIRENLPARTRDNAGGVINWFRNVDKDPYAVRHAYFYNAMMYFEGNRSEAFRVFFPGEWSLDPHGGWFHLTTQPSYQDFFSYYLDLWFKHWTVPGLYFDEVYLPRDYNVFNGNGKIMPDGTVRGSFALMLQREYLNRMRQLFIDNNQEPFIWVHSSNFMAPYAISAADIAMFGEDRTPNPTTDIIDAIPPILFRSIGRSQKFGFIPVWMTMAGRGGPQWGLAARQSFGWCWQHDVVPEIHPVGRGRHLFSLRADWGIGADDVSFIPYWNTGGALKTNDENLIASAWVRPGGRVMIQIMNLDHSAKDAVLTLDPKHLGLTGNYRVLDIETGPDVKVYLADMAEIDRLTAIDPNAPIREITKKWNNFQDQVKYDTAQMETLATGPQVKLNVAPRNFRTLIIEPR